MDRQTDRQAGRQIDRHALKKGGRDREAKPSDRHHWIWGPSWSAECWCCWRGRRLCRVGLACFKNPTGALLNTGLALSNLFQFGAIARASRWRVRIAETWKNNTCVEPHLSFSFWTWSKRTCMNSHTPGPFLMKTFTPNFFTPNCACLNLIVAYSQLMCIPREAYLKFIRGSYSRHTWTRPNEGVG